MTASLVRLKHAEALDGGGGVTVQVPERTRIVACLELESKQYCFVFALRYVSRP